MSIIRRSLVVLPRMREPDVPSECVLVLARRGAQQAGVVAVLPFPTTDVVLTVLTRLAKLVLTALI